MANNSGLRLRLSHLCNDLWGGKWSKMARGLKCSQATLWNLMHGHQAFSGRLLTAFATNTDISLHWLITGRGPRTVRDDAVPASARRSGKVVVSAAAMSALGAAMRDAMMSAEAERKAPKTAKTTKRARPPR